MPGRSRWACLFLAAVAMLSARPAFAAGVDCSRTHAPVVRTICAYPKILALDAQLASTYAAALARDPSHAGDLRQDEINWLGQRNRELWWQLAGQLEFPSLPGTLESVLARFYQSRIAFLQDVDNPAAVRDAPIAHRLLELAAAWPSSATDPLEALRSSGTIVTAKERGANDVEQAITKLAAAPDAALRAALDRFQPYPYTVEYLPSAGLGGAYVVEGTADCQYWVLFQKRGDVTVPVRGNSSLGGCTRDEGATGYLALLDGRPVALTVTNDPAFWTVTDFQWRQWMGGSIWGPDRRVRFRYAYAVKPGARMYCPTASQQCTSSFNVSINKPVDCPAASGPCASTGSIALRVAKRYLHNAVALAYPIGQSRAGQAHLEQLLQLAPNRKDWANCAYPVWFALSLDGKPALGGISESHLACHPGGASLDVGFWQMRGHDGGWWFVDNTVDVDRDRLLCAAIAPPIARDP